MRKGIRSVISSFKEGTVYITLPSEWVKENNIKRGDKVHWVSNGVLIIIPESKKEFLSKIEGGFLNDNTRGNMGGQVQGQVQNSNGEVL